MWGTLPDVHVMDPVSQLLGMGLDARHDPVMLRA